MTGNGHNFSMMIDTKRKTSSIWKREFYLRIFKKCWSSWYTINMICLN